MTIHGTGFPDNLSTIDVGAVPARVAFSSATRLVISIPAGVDGSRVPMFFDRDGSLFVTYSGSRGQEAPVSIFRVNRDGNREPYVSGIVNATSMALGPDGKLYVSSRFEGTVYRVAADGSFEQVATDLGVACGIAFDHEGSMYVGDRSGTIFRVRDGRRATR